MRQTLFTPTYNRADTLPRLYESIKIQSFKDFVWLIVDDGSIDNTREIINSFLKENIVQIKYVFKENGGKHTAQRLAYNIAETPYITEIDSDDTLLPSAMEEFENAWNDIEKNNYEIAKISMFVACSDGTLLGYGDYSIKGKNSIDANWHDYVLKMNIHKELLSSISVTKFKECIQYERYSWTAGMPSKFLGESILWASLGKKYKTRILMKVGRMYYTDATNSIMRGSQNYFNNMTNHLYFIEDNINYFFYNPKYFIREEKMMIANWHKTDVSFLDLYNHIKSFKHKFLFIFTAFPLILYTKLNS